ncbi:hypothetical protein PTSG_09336 [Salpingoeca rosetta]|uniref:VWFA domain-containing protein n=1 Tax=Salpingoeca rosetta (strain ATCC 50818 / BSB-021) TaxID=946362 RepID=F2UMC2_SALR5|nr:uncharacterized protein PTSG_09336 [Salpingoeca rosetta]EGD78271.1 hypothetical protein PTSG_09336 [Salpingoeca rosetta]|eukprot:XP_004989594.1 hypothetical protein PTSG_09336 [Salpingoeca rosetta]
MDLPEAEGIDAVCDKIMHAGPNGGTDFDIVVDRLAREIDGAMEVSTAKPDEQHQLYLVVMTDGVASMPSDDRFQALSSAVEKFNSASMIGNEVNMYVAGVGATHETEFLARMQKVVPQENSFYLFAREHDGVTLDVSLREALRSLEEDIKRKANKSRMRCNITLPDSLEQFHVTLREGQDAADYSGSSTMLYGELVHTIQAEDEEVVWHTLRTNLNATTLTVFGYAVDHVSFEFTDVETLPKTEAFEAHHTVYMQEVNSWTNLVGSTGLHNERAKSGYDGLEQRYNRLMADCQAILDDIDNELLPQDDREYVEQLHDKEQECHTWVVRVQEKGPDRESLAVLRQITTSVEGPLVRQKTRRRLRIDTLKPRMSASGEALRGMFQFPKLRMTPKRAISMRRDPLAHEPEAS